MPRGSMLTGHFCWRQGSERDSELQPIGLAIGTVANTGFILPFGAEEPAVPAGVLHRRADGEGAATVAIGGIDLGCGGAVGSAALVIAHLLVSVATHPA